MPVVNITHCSNLLINTPVTHWSRRLTLSSFQRISPLDLALVTRQAATLVGAGIPLVEALNAVVEQLEHAYLKTVMGQVRERVNEGAPLADALAETGEFDTLFVSMIRAGEASGGLAAVLVRIADHVENSVRLANKVGSILAYPAFMLVFTLIVVATLVTVVLPQITSLLTSMDQELPFYTRWIISGSDFARSYWWAMGLGAG